MNHGVVLPVVIPLLTAVVIMLWEAWQRRRQDASSSTMLAVSRTVSWVGLLAQCIVAAGLIVAADGTESVVYRLGNWPSPYAIVLVLDRMSAVMIAVTCTLAVFVLLAAQGGYDGQGRYFHALLALQLMGLHGAFLTGDLFNLFVFFEILLIASYGLLLFGGGAQRVSAGFAYIVLNLVGSGLFLIAVGVLYGVLGTLNMADMGLRAEAAVATDRPLLQTAALLLVIVFALKGALAPIHLWLPRTYSEAIAPVTALFAVMTKVGLYAIVRVVPVSFGPLLFSTDGLPSEGVLAQWLLPAACLTLVLATLGAAATTYLKQFACFLILASVGTAAIAISSFSPEGFAAAIYYMIHSTIVLGGFFLLTDLIARQRGPLEDRLTSGRLTRHTGRLSVLFLVLAAAAVGLPPSSGFIGKFWVLDAVWEHPAVRSQVWTVIIGTSFVLLVVASRVGSVLFWNVGSKTPQPTQELGVRSWHLIPVYGLVAVAMALAIFADPVARYAKAAAVQLLDRDSYIDAVMTDDTPTPKAAGVTS